MSFRNILRSTAIYEHINPAAFDKVITILQYSTSKNAIGEDVRAYASAGTQRGMIGHLDASMEDIEKHTNKTLKVVAKVFTWYNALLLDTKNRISIDGVEYDVVEAEEVFGRKRFVRLKVIQFV